MTLFEKTLRACFDIAGVAVIALMAVTVVDIVGRHLGILNLRGTIEMSNGVTVLIGFLAFPFSFLVGGHLILDTFTNWLAGGGIKGGVTYGASDEWSYRAVQDPTYCYDIHATILYLFGIEHTKLTYRYSGRDFRLTDVEGKVLHDLIA